MKAVSCYLSKHLPSASTTGIKAHKKRETNLTALSPKNPPFMYFYTEMMERFSRMNFQKEFEPLNYFIIFIPELYNKIFLKMIIKYILYDFNYPFVIQEELRSLGTSIWIYVIAVSSLRKPALCIVQLPPSSSLKSRPPPPLRSSPSSTSVSSDTWRYT